MRIDLLDAVVVAAVAIEVARRWASVRSLRARVAIWVSLAVAAAAAIGSHLMLSRAFDRARDFNPADRQRLLRDDLQVASLVQLAAVAALATAIVVLVVGWVRRPR